MPGLAYISSEEDSDGVFRHYPMVTNVDDIYFPSLGLLSYQLLSGDNPSLDIHDNGMGTLKLYNEKQELYLNYNGENKVRFLGNANNFDAISLYDVLQAPDGDEKLKHLFSERVIFIGSTAIGAHDLRNSPVDTKLPGVYVHMNILHMLMDGYFYQELSESIKWSFVLMFVGIIIFLFAQSKGSALADLITVIALTAGVYYVDQLYFLPAGYELKLFFVILCFISVYSWVTFLNFAQTSKEKKQIRGTFARYVAPSIVNEMLQHPEKLQTGGDRMDITCMFSDVRDFTSISEGLSPQQLSTVMNEYMNKMTGIVFETQGTLDKYIGDAIVAYWGAPLPVEGHPGLAVEAAIRMINIMPELNREFEEKGYPEFKIGIGLNSGECSVGNMGSDFIFSYTALGDNMNLGARLEGLCKPYGSQITVSEYTWERIDHTKFKGRILDKVKVKGKEKPVAIYEIFHDHHPLKSDPKAVEMYDHAYRLFVDQFFDQACQYFEAFLEKYPDDVAAGRLLKVCLHYLEAPPMPGEEHDVTTFTTK
jgi:adenylate cyclase